MRNDCVSCCQQRLSELFILIAQRLKGAIEKRLIFVSIARHGLSLPPQRLYPPPRCVAALVAEFGGLADEFTHLDLNMRLVEF